MRAGRESTITCALAAIVLACAAGCGSSSSSKSSASDAPGTQPAATVPAASPTGPDAPPRAIISASLARSLRTDFQSHLASGRRVQSDFCTRSAVHTVEYYCYIVVKGFKQRPYQYTVTLLTAHRFRVLPSQIDVQFDKIPPPKSFTGGAY